MKEGLLILSITKNEMEYLTKVCGVPHGEGGVSHTYAHHKSLFLTETARNVKLLREYREKRILK